MSSINKTIFCLVLFLFGIVILLDRIPTHLVIIYLYSTFFFTVKFFLDYYFNRSLSYHCLSLIRGMNLMIEYSSVDTYDRCSQKIDKCVLTINEVISKKNIHDFKEVREQLRIVLTNQIIKKIEIF